MLRRHRDERGAAAVEFALILPLLVMLVFGIVQFSIAHNRTQGLHAAAREGARLASLPNSTSSDIIDRVNEALGGVVESDDVTIEIRMSNGSTSSQPCNQNSGETVIVTVEHDYTISVPMIDGGAVTLTGKGEFRCE